MKQFDSPVRGNMLHMRSLRDEHNGSTACNDADPRPTLRNRVQCIYLTPPLYAQAGPKVQIGLSSRLQPDLMGALYGDAVEVLARAARCPRQTGHPLHDGLQSLREMGP